MPLYDCMLLMKPHVRKEAVMDLVTRVGKRVYQRNGVVADIKSFGTVQLGYGVKKLDGRHFQGQLMQMTVMVPPTFPKELHYLNKEDRLLRWLVVKHRDIKFGGDFFQIDDGRDDSNLFSRGGLFDKEDGTEDDDDDEDDESDEEEEGEQEML